MKEYFSRADQFPTLTVLINAPDTLAGQTWRVTLPLAGLTLDGRATQDAIISAVFSAQFGGATVPADVSLRLLANAHAAAWTSGFDPRQTPLGSIGFEIAFGSDFAGITDVPLVFTVATLPSDAPALADIALPTVTTNTTSLTLKDIAAGAVSFHSEIVPCCSPGLTAISGQEIITDLIIGAATEITVSHSSNAVFGSCDDPLIVAPVPTGIRVTPLTLGTNGDAKSGAQFVWLIENVGLVADGGYGGAAPDLVLNWTRIGQVGT